MDRICEEMLDAAVWRLDRIPAATLLLRADSLARHVRRVAIRSQDPTAAARVTERWLADNFGGCDDALRRASVAAMTLGLDLRAAGAPPGLRAGYAAACDRLARRLAHEGPYVRAAFAADAGFAAGLVLPVEPFRAVTPGHGQGDGAALRVRRGLGFGARLARSYGASASGDWLRRAGLHAWIDLHLDLRACRAFHLEGFHRAYGLLADLLRTRPDLAGLRAASWLFDPALAHVSPALTFVRRSAEAGGARFVRVRTAPEQQAFAAARSPERRRLIEAGAYRPACYMMSWLADDLIAWSNAPITAHLSCSSLCLLS